MFLNWWFVEFQTAKLGTTETEIEVETGVLNAYGTAFFRWPQLECLLDKPRHNAVLGSPKPMCVVAFQLPALVMCDIKSDTIS